MYFKRIVRAKLLKFCRKDLLELGTGRVGIDLRPLESSLTLSSERAFLERFFYVFLVLSSSVVG